MNSPACRSHDWEFVEPAPSNDPDVPVEDPGHQLDAYWTCRECGETAGACMECSKPLTTSLTVCDRCIDRAKKVVHDIVKLVDSDLTPDPYSPIHSARYDRDNIAASEDDVRLPFGLDAFVSDPDDPRIGALRTVPEAVRVLDRWARAWASTRGVRAPDDAPAFLVEHMLWAMQNREASRWSQYSTEARQARAVIRRLLGVQPERLPTPCVHCGGLVVHEWTNQGLDEKAKCTGCLMEWEHDAQLLHTNHLVIQDLPSSHPNALVSLEEANTVYRGKVVPTLFYKWAARGHIVARRTDRRGVSLYRLGDIEDLYQVRIAKRHADAG